MVAQRLAAVAVLVGVLLAACSEEDTGPDRASSATSTTKAETAKTALKVEPVVSYEAPEADVGRAVTWEHYLAWAGSPAIEANYDHISIRDLMTGETRVVARQESPKGHTDWVRGSKDTIVYTDLARVQSDNDRNVPWKLFTLDLITGDRKLLAQSRTPADQQLPPLPEIEWPWVVWGAAAPGQTSRAQTAAAFVHDLRSGKTRVMTTLPAAEIAGVSVTENKVVVGRLAGGKYNLFSFDAEAGTEPTTLTSTGDVEAPMALNGSVAWHQRVVPDPPKGIWVQPVVGGTPIKLADGGTGPIPGRGFVVWYDTGQNALLARASDAKSPAVQLAGADLSVAGRWWAWEDRAVWTTVTNLAEPTQRTTIHVARLTS